MSKATITVEAFVASQPEIRVAGQHRVIDLSLPHTPSRKTDNGWEDAGPTTWYQATFWDEHADKILDTVDKGTLVVVSGFPELEVYEKRDGTPGGKVKINFPTLSVVVRRPKSGTSSTPPEEPWATPDGWTETAPAAGDWGAPASYEDSTPF